MGAPRLPAPKRGLLAVAATIALVLVAGTAAQRVPLRAAAGPLALVTPTAADCAKIGAPPGVVVFGKACEDRRGLTHAEAWTVDGSSAHWAENDFGASYEWDVPDTVPAAGAPLTLKLAVARITPGAQTCVRMSAKGGFTLRTATGEVPQAELSSCAVSGAPSARNLTVTLVPPAAKAGAVVPLQVTVENGPTISFSYSAGGTLAVTPYRFSAGAHHPSRLRSPLGRHMGWTDTESGSGLRVHASYVDGSEGSKESITADFKVVSQHLGPARETTILRLGLEVTAVHERGTKVPLCAEGTKATLVLTDDNRRLPGGTAKQTRDAVRLTVASARCRYLEDTFSNRDSRARQPVAGGRGGGQWADVTIAS